MKRKTQKKRKCRCFELTGKKFQGCKGYIDNGNYYFCSVCHKELSRRGYFDTFSAQAELAGEQVERETHFLYI